VAAPIRITEYTDPGCPWAWNAEPVRARLDYLYGDCLEWRVRMVGLSDEPKTGADYDPQGWARRMKKMAREHPMPIDTRPREYGAATIPACRLVAGAKVHRPDAVRRVLRQLRVRNWSGEQLDAPETLDAVAADAGIDAAEARAWQDDEAVEAKLREDMAAAREPLPAARALDHKLGNWSGGRRYTCPSYEVLRHEDGVHIAIPGFQPFAAYEVVLANLAPVMDRREAPASVAEVLEWSGIPMATAEVAAVMDADFTSTREDLARTARLEPVGADGFWTLA
jgi:predicted DsbA family dithiol-disulfide isomerase